MSYCEQFTNSLRQAGLNVTRVMITGPLPCPNETVADQMVHQLGPPSTWQQLRQVITNFTFLVFRTQQGCIYTCMHVNFLATASQAFYLEHSCNLQKSGGFGDHVRLVFDRLCASS